MAEQECLGGAPLSTLEVTLGGRCLAPSMSSRWEVAFSKGFLSSETGPQLQKPQLSLSSFHLPREPTWRTHRTLGHHAFNKACSTCLSPPLHPPPKQHKNHTADRETWGRLFNGLRTGQNRKLPKDWPREKAAHRQQGVLGP